MAGEIWANVVFDGWACSFTATEPSGYLLKTSRISKDGPHGESLAGFSWVADVPALWHGRSSNGVGVACPHRHIGTCLDIQSILLDAGSETGLPQPWQFDIDEVQLAPLLEIPSCTQHPRLGNNNSISRALLSLVSAALGVGVVLLPLLQDLFPIACKLA
jgi:hypothetical protein